MTPAEFEVRLMQCLDERRDPFADAELAEQLAADPEAAVRVADLLARLEVVTRSGGFVVEEEAARGGGASSRPRALRRGVLRLCAALLLAAAAFAVWGPSPQAPEAPGRVVRASLSTVDQRPLRATVTVRTVLAEERGLRFQTFDTRVVRR